MWSGLSVADCVEGAVLFYRAIVRNYFIIHCNAPKSSIAAIDYIDWINRQPFKKYVPFLSHNIVLRFIIGKNFTKNKTIEVKRVLKHL